MTIPTKAQRELIFKQIGYYPTAEQDRIHDCSARIRIVAGGERSGKSKSSAADLTTRLFFGQLFWLVAADYERTKMEFTYLQDYLASMGIRFQATKQVDPGEILVLDDTGKGVVFRIVTKSAKDPRKLAYEAPDGILVCEASQIDFETYLRLMGRLAEKRGWLLMSGCLAGDSLVLTEEGIIPIEKLVGQITHPIDLQVYSDGKTRKAELAWYNGANPSVKIELSKGFRLEGTPDHKIITNRGWIELKDLSLNDKVAIPYNMNLWGKLDTDTELAYKSGVYIAEGCWDAKYNRISIASGEPEIIELFKNLGYKHSPKTFQLRKTDHDLASKFTSLGIDRKWKACTKEVPEGIMKSKREVVVAFLQGLFDGDGCASTEGRICYTTVSKKLAQQVHILLLNLGIVATLGQRKDKCWTIYANESQNFSQIVGFRLPRKQKVLLDHRNTRNRTFLGGKKECWGSLKGQKVFWASVNNKSEGFCQSYDLKVSESHMYCANGIWVHNTFESSLGWY